MDIISAPPKSRQIADHLRRGILSGDAPPGSRVGSVRDLAGRFEVSNAVICAAFDILEREALIVREHGRGTFVADRITPPETRRIFALLTGSARTGLTDYLESLSRAARDANALAMPVDLPKADDLDATLDIVLAEQPRAVFLDAPTHAVPLERVRRLAGSAPVCPVHHWDWYSEASGPCVVFDAAEPYRRGFEYLLGKGHRSILVVDYYRSPPHFQVERMHRALSALGFEDAPPWLHTSSWEDLESAPEAVDSLFASSEPPTAVVGHSDHLVWMYRQKLLARRPDLDGLELCGCYDTDWSRQDGCAFHSFRMDFETMWRTAFRLFHDPVEPRNDAVVIMPEFVERPNP